MEPDQVVDVVVQVRRLVEDRYVFPDVAADVSQILSDGLREGRYPADEQALADAVTADLQSVNSDRHLRLVYRADPLAARPPDDDADEYAAMAAWAAKTCGGVAGVQCLADNIGYLDLSPVLFPVVLCGEVMTAAMTVIASTDALIVDLRRTLGGDPAMVAFVISYLVDQEPVQLTGLRERAGFDVAQSWTLPYVPGPRFGRQKPVYVLTSATTFSGGEQLTFDLKRLGRATIVGERTRGGANARAGFPVHRHLEATISVAAAVSPTGEPNWEGTGIAPDVEVVADLALETAQQLVTDRLASRR